MWSSVYRIIALCVVCVFFSYAGFLMGEIYGENTGSYIQGWSGGYGAGYNRCQLDLIVDHGVNPTDLRPHVLINSRISRPSVIQFISGDTTPTVIHAPGLNREESNYVHQ